MDPYLYGAARTPGSAPRAPGDGPDWTSIRAEIVLLEGEAWREFFDAFNDYAFLLEMLPDYGAASEDDEFRRFLAGEPRPDEELANPLAPPGAQVHRLSARELLALR